MGSIALHSTKKCTKQGRNIKERYILYTKLSEVCATYVASWVRLGHGGVFACRGVFLSERAGRKAEHQISNRSRQYVVWSENIGKNALTLCFVKKNIIEIDFQGGATATNRRQPHDRP